MIRSGLLSVCLLASCAACCSKTTVILLPDENEQSAVVVSTESSTKTIDTPYQSAMVGGLGTEEITLQVLNEDTVTKTYGASLKALPDPPLSFTLYFINGSSELTEESRAELETIIALLKKRGSPSGLNIIGHTDATGSKLYNKKLSLERAQAVEHLLRAAGTRLDVIRIQSFGENDPLIPTPDGVAEPKNRRVEVMVL